VVGVCQSLLEGRSYRVNLELLVENLNSEDLYDLLELVTDRVVRRSKMGKVKDEEVEVKVA
jgi:hypothetical protein